VPPQAQFSDGLKLGLVWKHTVRIHTEAFYTIR